MKKASFSPRFPNMSLFRQLVVLFALMFIGLCLTSFIGEVAGRIFGSGTRETLLTLAAVQNILTFAAPVIVTVWLTERNPWQFTGISECVAWRPVIAMIALYALGLPALNQTIWWNEHINLPYSMQSLQSSLIEMEQTARAATEAMMHGTSAGTLVVNIFIIGILTGVCEEIFFRAGLQRLLHKQMSATAAIWIGALVFSVMHFQFFGFVPRVLLGAFFGYLYHACGSLWLNAGAHALNNSLVVTFTWLADRGADTESIDMFGVSTSGYPYYAVLSAIMVAAVLIFFRHKLFYPLHGKKKK